MKRLLPEVSPDEGVNRDELALLLGVETDDASAVLLAEIGDGLTVLHRLDDDGHDAFRLGDVEAICERRKRDPRSPSNPRPSNRRSSTPPAPASTDRIPLAPEVRDQGGVIFADDQVAEAILLSDDAGNGSAGKSKAIRIRDAAEQVGLTEEELTTRLIGKAHLAMHEGQMVVKLADLDRLAKSGAIPKPSTVKAVREATGEAEGTKAASADPAVEARIAASAAAIGVEPDTVRAKSAEPSSAEQRTGRMANLIGVDLGEAPTTNAPGSPPATAKQEATSATIVKARPRDPRPGMGRPQRLRPARLANNG